MNSNPFDLPKQSHSYWKDSSTIGPFKPLSESLIADVGVVGGGITGITVAYLLAKQKKKVVLLESKSLLNGITGHTTGKITAQHSLVYHNLLETLGLSKASLYYRANEEALRFIKNIIKKNEIKCNFKYESAYLFTDDASYIKQLELEMNAYDKLNIPSALIKDVPLDIPVEMALKMKHQAQFHPIKYLNYLLEKCLQMGVKIYEHTTAIDVEQAQSQHPTILTNHGHKVKCRQIIAASHYPFYDDKKLFPVRMYADRSYLLAMQSKDPYPGGMYININKPTRSIRSIENEGQELWLVGGENHKTGQAISTEDHFKTLQTYGQDKLKLTEVMYRWSAQDLVTLDNLPYIGSMKKDQSNIFVATGFNKWGMTTGTIAAKIIHDLIIYQESPYKDLFSPSRSFSGKTIKSFFSFNTNVAKHLLKGKFEIAEKEVKNLPSDEATKIQVNGNKIGVYKDLDNKLHLVDTTCTHLGCEVNWNKAERTWDCPCHGSRFSFEGTVIDGPAKKPLKSKKFK